MKRLIIVCEGPTENEFCLEMLAPILLKSDIYVEAPLIKKSNGGIVPWQAIKRQIETHLHEGDAKRLYACGLLRNQRQLQFSWLDRK